MERYTRRYTEYTYNILLCSFIFYRYHGARYTLCECARLLVTTPQVFNSFPPPHHLYLPKLLLIFNTAIIMTSIYTLCVQNFTACAVSGLYDIFFAKCSRRNSSERDHRNLQTFHTDHVVCVNFRRFTETSL